MSLYNVIFKRLTADATFAALVGTRVFETVAIGNPAMPYVVVDVEREADESLQATGETPYTLTLDIVTAAPASRTAVTAAAIALLDRAQWTDGDTRVEIASLESEQQATLTTDGAPEALTYNNNLTFFVLTTGG